VSFFDIPEDERQAVLEAKRALAVVMTRDGQAADTVGSTADPSLAYLVEVIEETGRLDAAFPEWTRADVQQLMHWADTGLEGAQQMFTADPARGRWDFSYDCGCWRDPEGNTYAVICRPSVWLDYGNQYKPHVYRRGFMNADEFWTNAHGFRDEEVELPKPDGVYRILCIGGSTTKEGLRNDYTYPAILERLLQERLGTACVEVFNCGVDAQDALGRQAVIEDLLTLDPDLVVHYGFVNDVLLLVDRWRRHASWSSAPQAKLWRIPLHSKFGFHRLIEWFVPTEAALLGAIDREIFSLRRSLTTWLALYGVDAAFCSFAYPDLDSLDEIASRYYQQPLFWSWTYPVFNLDTFARLCEIYREQLLEYCAREDLLYIPLLEEMPRTEAYFYDSVHLHPQGIQRKAEIVAEHLAPFVAGKLGR